MNSNHTLKREAAHRRRIEAGTLRGVGRGHGPPQFHHASPRLASGGSYLRVKRALDVILSAALLVLALPVMIVAGILVRLTSRGPAIYVQYRVGLGGVEFPIFKIRTMVDNCESLTGPRWSMPGDPRITRVGAVLRATHIDELPQLWNVIRGDMSLIGPRPERPEIIRKLVRDLPNYRDRLAVRPGITGLAQVQLPPDSDLSSVADKLVLDCAYIDQLGVGLDLRILVCTALKLVGISALRRRFLVQSAIPASFEPGINVPPTRRAA